MNARSFLPLGFGLCATALCGAEVRLQLPLARTAYQCNESIPLTVLRSGAQSQRDGELMLRLSAGDGSSLTFTFLTGRAEAHSVEHLQVNGWLLRPGSYTARGILRRGDGTNEYHAAKSHPPQRFQVDQLGAGERERPSWRRGRMGLDSTWSMAKARTTRTPT